MRRERTYIVITLATAIGVNLVGVLLARNWNPAIYVGVPIVLLLLLYLLVTSQLLRMESSIMERVESVSPRFHYIAGEDSVKRTLIEAIDATEEFIFCTGGRARDAEYLGSLAHKVLTTNVKYYRVILGRQIHHPLHEHLSELLRAESGSAHVGHALEEKYGNMLVTDKKVIHYLPSATFGGLETVLKIENPGLAARYQLYIMRIYGESERITGDAQLRGLCIECRD